MKSNVPNSSDPVTALRSLSLEQIDQRIAELDGERASLALIRRSLLARRRAEQRTIRRPSEKPEARR